MLPATKCEFPYTIWRTRRCVTECGFREWKEKSRIRTNARRWSRHICAHFYTCVHACGSKTAHACTCELTIECTRFSVSHRRLFPHVVLRHDSLFCSRSGPTRPNPYPRLFLLHFFLSLFLLVFLERALCNRGLPRTTSWFRIDSVAIESCLETFHIDSMTSKVK